MWAASIGDGVTVGFRLKPQDTSMSTSLSSVSGGTGGTGSSSVLYRFSLDEARDAPLELHGAQTETVCRSTNLKTCFAFCIHSFLTVTRAMFFIVIMLSLSRGCRFKFHVPSCLFCAFLSGPSCFRDCSCDNTRVPR